MENTNYFKNTCSCLFPVTCCIFRLLTILELTWFNRKREQKSTFFFQTVLINYKVISISNTVITPYMRQGDLRLQAADPVLWKFGSGRKRHHNRWKTPLVRTKQQNFSMKGINLEHKSENLLCVPLVSGSILTLTCRNG